MNTTLFRTGASFYCIVLLLALRDRHTRQILTTVCPRDRRAFLSQWHTEPMWSTWLTSDKQDGADTAAGGTRRLGSPSYVPQRERSQSNTRPAPVNRVSFLVNARHDIVNVPSRWFCLACE